MAAAAFQSERRSSSAGPRTFTRDDVTWSVRGIDNHVKRPAGVSSAGMKRAGLKRIDHRLARQPTIEANFKMDDDCITVSSCSDYGTRCVMSQRKSPRIDPARQHPAGIEASKTVQYNNHWSERDWKTSKDSSGAAPGRAPAWLMAFQTKRRIEPPDSWDPIKHDFIRPRSWVPRSMRRMGYDNAANRESWNLMNSTNTAGPLDSSFSKERLTDIAAKVHISNLNEIIFNVAGGEDLLPPATNEFVKADLPSSQQQQYENDCRHLSLFEQERSRNMYSRGGNPQLVESPDMYLCLHGCAENALQNDIPQPPYPYPSKRADGGTPSQRSDFQTSPSTAYYSDYFSMTERDSDYYSDRGSRSVGSPMKPQRMQSARNSAGRRSNVSEPMSARSSRRSDTRRSYDDVRSLASSAFSDSSSFMRRSKSVDRSPFSPMSEGGQSAGLFSNPRNTATATALREALADSRR